MKPEREEIGREVGRFPSKGGSVERDPERIYAQLEKEFGEELNPALRRVLKEREAIQAWLRKPGNAAAFKADPVGTLRKQFPDLELKKGVVEGPIYVPVSLGGIDLGGVDQATLDFFAEVWEYVSDSEANAKAFEADRKGTITLLGRGKPERAVQQVIEAFRLNQSGGGSSGGGSKWGRVANEAIFHEGFDPVGPVASMEGFLTQFLLPPSEEEY
ncbi:MAG: hypothetical protein ACTHN7_12245 [Solirubrobacterales bacterium]